MSNTPNIDPERLDAWMEDSLKRRDSKYARMESINAEMLEVLQELDESAYYWSQYDVPVGIHDRIKSAIAKAKGESHE
jgi:hypothetical protein